MRSSRPALALAALTTAATCLVAAPTASAAEVSPPGANDWDCRTTQEHPYPVVLVPGTFETMLKNWSVMSPYLKQRGYCVFSLNYGSTNGVPATGPIEDSAVELKAFVDRVLQATGARKVDLVGHSQGGMMPRQYLGFLGGAHKVNELVGIAPSSHGTEGLIVPSEREAPSSGVLCPACDQQQAGSAFLEQLNSIGDTVGGPDYTTIATRHDEVVTPFTSQALAGPARRVTNVVIQDLCPLDPVEHDQAPNDPVVLRLVADALDRENDPLSPALRPSCLL